MQLMFGPFPNPHDLTEVQLEEAQQDLRSLLLKDVSFKTFQQWKLKSRFFFKISGPIWGLDQAWERQQLAVEQEEVKMVKGVMILMICDVYNSYCMLFKVWIALSTIDWIDHFLLDFPCFDQFDGSAVRHGIWSYRRRRRGSQKGLPDWLVILAFVSGDLG